MSDRNSYSKSLYVNEAEKEEEEEEILRREEKANIVRKSNLIVNERESTIGIVTLSKRSVPYSKRVSFCDS